VTKKWFYSGIGIMVVFILIVLVVANDSVDKTNIEAESMMVSQAKRDYYKAYNEYLSTKKPSEEVVDYIYELSVEDMVYYFESTNEIEQVLMEVVELSTENVKNIEVKADGDNVVIDFDIIPTLSVEIIERNFVMAAPNTTYSDENSIVQVTPNAPTEILMQLDFKEDVSVKPVIKELQDISNVVSVVEELLKLNVEPAEYIIESGDSASVIAEKNGMKLTELYELNPWLIDRERTLQIGEELVVEKLIPELSIVNCYMVTKVEPIEPEIIYQEDDTIYTGLTVVADEGEVGTEILKVDVDIVNDEIIDEAIVDTLVVEESLPQIVLVGTSPVPENGPAGFFVSPLNNYRLTSTYGPRWGRTHRGLDMAVSTGTSVKASDGGTVIFAGWDSGYGYRVDIDHGNGIITRYAHNSRLLVEYGEEVGQGEVIAKSGNTGNSTGPHLHFEVIVDGNAMNPYDFIG
jgi:LysM repeat protein